MILWEDKEGVVENCKHEWGKYRPNGEEGAILVCVQCGVELDVITRQPIPREESEKV